MKKFTVESDVTVIGGGLAGVAAAIAAAREGATVALINNRPVLGGNSSSEVRVWVCGATAHGSQKFARETGIMGELFIENQYRNPEGNPHLWDQVVLDAVRAEPLITMYLNTDVRDVDADGADSDRTIRSVTGWQMGSEKLITFVGAMFIDATGDGIVGHLAGAWAMTGREAAAEFGEEWAPEIPDSNMLGSTILFYSKDVGEPVRFVPPSIAKDISTTSILDNRRVRATDNGCDYWWIEWGGELDAVDDNEAIRDELWGVVYGIWDHIKNSGLYDADTLTLEWVGSVPGKREYRRFIGDTILTQNDIMNQVRFPDTIGFGGWSIDLHPPGGMYSVDEGSKHLFTKGIYHIPFGALYSKNVSNMLMAGRDISATHVAFGTTRVMATCAVTGEAAGTGAALSVRHGVTPRTLATERLGELQTALLRADASIVGRPWTDPSDLALTAQVTASSTITSIDVEPRPDEQPHAVTLDGHDIGIIIPADPRIDTVQLLLDASRPTLALIELWRTDGGENHIPVEKVSATEARVEHPGHSWVTARFDYTPDQPENVVVVIDRNPDLKLVVLPRSAPYGVLGLVSRTPRFQMDGPQSNAWSAFEMRRSAPAIRVTPDTNAYAAAHVSGGFQRPFDGPQLWSSRPLGEDGESVVLTWDDPQSVRSVEVLFNDDVDEDLVNLHHHRTPFPVVPEVVRDYGIDFLTEDGWVRAETVLGNRVRRRVHRWDEAAQVKALRLVATATNGAECVTVAGIRAFS
ncbi:FAD-dependent oxidoreductase [Leifsonia flava]|uniref:FAD-dependent oxidoreductase n=1 Tax=Orlajensenia leifsoniae TaxID=2561933 RepID=A0A4Y9R5L5_9MICO|nr:FAD-dependent oxidoreductase [Leifsonia flava]TFV99914.1 FAD-dependent oxidoreductase [Leifsonia flava]